MKKLKSILEYIEVSDCKMEEGSYRADVNVSVHKPGTPLGTRTEMKNLNSFRAIARAIENERARQIDIIESGGKVVQETRRWDDNKEYSYAMRSKEDAQDYRYFPEPDLVPISISNEWIARIKDAQPEFRDEKKLRYKEEYDLPDYDIDIITNSKHLADIFEETISITNKPKEVSNWLMGDTMKLLKSEEKSVEDIAFSPKNLARLIDIIDEGKINRTMAKEVFEQIFKDDVDPDSYIKEHDMGMVSDDGALKTTIEEIVANNPQSVADYKSGKTKAMGFIVGQTMKAMKGKADPQSVNRIVKEILDNM